MSYDNSLRTAAIDDGVDRFPDLHVLPVVAEFLAALETNDVSAFVRVIKPRATRGCDGKSRPPMGTSKERVDY